jgi:hypothetical protein
VRLNAISVTEKSVPYTRHYLSVSLSLIFQVERQIQMQNQMRERMMAMQVARARELLYWFGSFYVLAALGMIAG